MVSIMKLYLGNETYCLVNIDKSEHYACSEKYLKSGTLQTCLTVLLLFCRRFIFSLLYINAIIATDVQNSGVVVNFVDVCRRLMHKQIDC